MFQQKALVLLFVGLFLLAIIYVELTEWSLKHPQRVRTEATSEQISLENHHPAPEDAVVHNATTPSSYTTHTKENATAAMEHLFDYYPVEQHRKRKKKKAQSSVPPLKHPNQATTTAPNVSTNLDFAIIGMAKTGTTFLQSTWLPAHPDIRLPPHECRYMHEVDGVAQIHKVMASLRDNNATDQTIFGYKNPQDINRPRSLTHFRDAFPETKLIIGLRHPVWWFQSFYNFRARKVPGPPPDTLIGPCRADFPDVCTDMANFHASLSTLGLTNRSSATESTLLATTLELRRALKPALPNPIFVYEQQQLDPNRNATVAEALRQDLSAFLGLATPLPALTRPYQPPRNRTLSICDASHAELRRTLVRIGQAAGTWIRDYFVVQPTVHVSSRETLTHLLEAWGSDPCHEE